MPENVKVDTSLTGSHKWVTPVLVALLVVIFAVSMVFGARHLGEGEEGFGGTDSAAAEAAEKAGAKPRSTPLFEPNSSEVESGLFAMQAALGAGILGYALGRMSGRKRGREEAVAASEPGTGAELAETDR